MTDKIITANWGNDEVFSLDGYRADGGYEALRTALDMTSADLIDVVKASGLRGRGGAGFPTGVKWSFVPQDTGKPTYAVANFDESEPGTFSNRELIEREPHQFLEGLAIATYAIGSHDAYVYCRGEFLWPDLVLQRAIAEAYDAGIFGESVLGTGYEINVVQHRGAGAYICGEETALLSSLEGYRGQPRLRPPFPAVEGLFGCPTLIFSVSGKVERPGNYELPMGSALRTLLEEHAGGVTDGKRLKAWTPGGSSTPMLTEEHLDVQLDFESIAAAGSLLGTGAIIVMDESDCIVEATRRLIAFYAHESCGKCTPCREGTWWGARVLERIQAGYGRPEDLPLLEDLGQNMLFRAFCALADGAVSPIQSSLKYFRDEYEAHIAERRCPFTGRGPGVVTETAEAPAGDRGLSEVLG